MLDKLRRLRPHLPVAAFFSLIAVAYVLFGHLTYWPSKLRHEDARAPGQVIVGWELSKPMATSGDEPHYLVIVNSLLFDHDLRVDPDFARIRAGGYEAGLSYRGHPFGGHTLLTNPRTGKVVACVVDCDDASAAKLGAPLAELYEMPSHPVMYSAFMALLALPFRPSPAEVEPLVGRFGIVVSLAGVLLTYAAARRSGLRAAHAGAATLVVGFASSWLAYERSYFAEPSIGLFLLLGFLALRTRRLVLAGVAVGIAMAMKPLFVVYGAAWIVERLWARRLRDAVILAASVGVCGVLLVTFNMIVLRVPMTAGAIPFAWAHGLSSFKDLFIAPNQGLLAFVPWGIIPFLWGPWISRPGVSEEEGRLAVDARRQIVIPMLLAVAAYSTTLWGAGYCYGPRYFVPLLPFMALLLIDFVLAGKWWRWAGVSVLVAVSMVYAVCGVVQYRWLFLKMPNESIYGPSEPK